MDPSIMTQTEEVSVVVVVSSLVTLCVLVMTTVWMCWRIRRGLNDQAEEIIETEFSLPEDTVTSNTLETQQTTPLQDDPPDGEGEEEEEENNNSDS